VSANTEHRKLATIMFGGMIDDVGLLQSDAGVRDRKICWK
jgi:hypothetical protein